MKTVSLLIDKEAVSVTEDESQRATISCIRDCDCDDCDTESDHACDCYVGNG